MSCIRSIERLDITDGELPEDFDPYRGESLNQAIERKQHEEGDE